MSVDEEGTANLWLQIAGVLAKKRMPSSQVSAELGMGVSGKTVGDVKKLMDAGMITIDEQGRPRLNVTVEEAEDYLDFFRSKTPDRKPKRLIRVQTPEEAVTRTLEKAKAEKARRDTEQTLIIGEAVTSAYFQYAAKKGWDLSTIRERPIHQEVLKALRESEKVPKLEREVNKLREELAFYQARADPFWRLERGIEMMSGLLELALLYKAVGLDLLRSEAARRYAYTVDKFIFGEM